MSLPFQLLLEGSDDFHVIRNLLVRERPDFKLKDSRTHAMSYSDDTAPSGWGINNLVKQIGVRMKDPDTRALAVVLDADEDPSARWESLRGQIPALPSAPITGGTVVDTGSASFGIWVMPDNNVKGALEDFLARLVPVDDPLWPRASEYVDGIPAADCKFGAKAAKAKLHAWLAVQEKPGRPLGLAVTNRVLDTALPSARSFLDWLSVAWIDVKL